MRRVTEGEHLFVDALSAYDIDILRRIGAQFPQQFFYTVHNCRVFDFVGRVRGQHNVNPAVQRLRHGKSLKSLSSVHNDLVKGLLSEHPVVTRDPDQKLSLVPYGPVLIHCRD